MPNPSSNYALKAGIVVILTAVIALFSVTYLTLSQNIFEKKHQLVLNASDASGLAVGMPLNLSGFPVGKVTRFKLRENGTVTVNIEILEKDLPRLLDGVTFWAITSLLGSTKLIIKDYNPSNPKLNLNKSYNLNIENLDAKLPEIITNVEESTSNIAQLTSQNSDLAKTIREVSLLATKLNDPNESLMKSLQNISFLLQRLANEETLMQKTIGQENFKSLTLILQNTAQITSSIKSSTKDMDKLREDIDDNVDNINHLVDDINSRWPFGTNSEFKTP